MDSKSHTLPKPLIRRHINLRTYYSWEFLFIAIVQLLFVFVHCISEQQASHWRIIRRLVDNWLTVRPVQLFVSCLLKHYTLVAELAFLLCPNRFSGLPTTRPSWPPAAPTGGSTCGTSARSERSSRRRTPRTVLQSCWSVLTVVMFILPSLSTTLLAVKWPLIPFCYLVSSSTVDTQPRSRTSRGTPTSRGSSAPCRRTTSCKCGRW